jgi:hypothetical protein
MSGARVPDHDPLLGYALDPHRPGALEAAWAAPVVVISDAASGNSPGRVGCAVTATAALGLAAVAAPVAVALQGRLSEVKLMAPALALGLVGVLLLILAWAAAKSFRHLKTSYVGIGPAGLTVRRGGHRVEIPWSEIVSVQVAVLYSRSDLWGGNAADWLPLADNPLELVEPKRFKTDVSPRIRFAPAPSFEARGAKGRLVRRSRGNALEPPFTHHLTLATRFFADERTVPAADLAAVGLHRFAGPKYAGAVALRVHGSPRR